MLLFTTITIIFKMNNNRYLVKMTKGWK